MLFVIGFRIILLVSLFLSLVPGVQAAKPSDNPCRDLVAAYSHFDVTGVYQAISQGCPINSSVFDKRQTILHRASIDLNPVWVDFLLHLGADASLRDADGKTPQDYASGLAALTFDETRSPLNVKYSPEDLLLLTKLARFRVLPLLSEKDLHTALLRSPFKTRGFFGLNKETVRYLALKYGAVKRDFLDICFDRYRTTDDDFRAVQGIIRNLHIPQGSTCGYAYMKFKSAKTLQLSKLGLSNLTALKYSENLQDLNLAGNNITDLEGIETLENLKNLNLSCNKIDNIRRLGLLKHLQDINLSFNKVTVFEPIVAIASLRKLNLVGNNISDFSALKALPVTCESIPERDFASHLEDFSDYQIYHNDFKKNKEKEEQEQLKKFYSYKKSIFGVNIESVYSDQFSLNLLNYRKAKLDNFLRLKSLNLERNIARLKKEHSLAIDDELLYADALSPYAADASSALEQIRQNLREIKSLQKDRKKAREISSHEEFEQNIYYQDDTMNLDCIGSEYFRENLKSLPLPSQGKDGRVMTVFIHGTKSRVVDAVPSEKYPFGNNISILSQNILGIKNIDFIIIDGITSHPVNDHEERYFPHGQSIFVPEATGEGLEEMGKHALGVMKGISAFQKHSRELNLFWSLFHQAKIEGISTVNIIGWSRGAIAAIKLAHMMNDDQSFQDVKVNIFAIDPVPGGFDSMHYDDKKFILNKNVKNFVGIYGEDEYSVFLTRMKPIVIDPLCTKTTYLRMPGMHSTVVGSAINKEEAGETKYDILSIGLIVRDIAEKFLTENGSKIINKLGFTDLEIVRMYEQALRNRKGYEELRDYTYFGLRVTKKKLLLSRNQHTDFSQEFPSYIFSNHINAHHREACEHVRQRWGENFDDLSSLD